MWIWIERTHSGLSIFSKRSCPDGLLKDSCFVVWVLLRESVGLPIKCAELRVFDLVQCRSKQLCDFIDRTCVRSASWHAAYDKQLYRGHPHLNNFGVHFVTWSFAAVRLSGCLSVCLSFCPSSYGCSEMSVLPKDYAWFPLKCLQVSNGFSET